MKFFILSSKKKKKKKKKKIYDIISFKNEKASNTFPFIDDNSILDKNY